MLSLTISETTQCFLCQQISNKYNPKSDRVRFVATKFVVYFRCSFNQGTKSCVGQGLLSPSL
ncbi:hypothetical protein Mapa_014056 [Marchantia paleacea]|nr:hypothetical protein Mapa_014056 [Marchantia paleacea]